MHACMPVIPNKPKVLVTKQGRTGGWGAQGASGSKGAHPVTDPGIYFGGIQVFRLKVESGARIEGAKRPSRRRESLIIEGEAQTESEAHEKTGLGV